MRKLRTLAAAVCFYIGYTPKGKRLHWVGYAWSFSGGSLLGCTPPFGRLDLKTAYSIRDAARAIAATWRSWS